MQKSSSVLHVLCQGWKPLLSKTLSSPAPRCNLTPCQGVRPATSFPLADLQNRNFQAQASRRGQQFISGQATAQHNVRHQQISESLRALTSMHRANFFAVSHSPHRAVAGMVCGGGLHPLCFPNYNLSLHTQTEASVAALLPGGHMKMSPRSGVDKDEGSPSSSCTNCRQPADEGSLTSSVEPNGVNMAAQQSSEVRPAVSSGVLPSASPPRLLPVSGRRFFCTWQRKPTSRQRPGAANSFPGGQGRSEGLARLVSRSDIKADNEHSLKILETDAAWALRLSSENVFLSWCRNTYLSSALGLAMHTAGGGYMYADTAAFLMFCLAGLNLLWGTGAYVHYLFSMGSLAQISRLSRLLQIAFALMQLLVWGYACICYFSSWDVSALLDEDWRDA